MTREPLAEPRREYTADNRLAWIGLIVLVAVVVGALWWWAPRTSESPAEAVGRVPTEEVVERPGAAGTRARRRGARPEPAAAR